MRKIFGLLIAAVLVAPSFGLYTDDAVTSYRLPTGVTPQIDGSIDDVWKGISTNGDLRLNFDDMNKTIFQNGNLQADYSVDPGAHITIYSAYDNANLYFLFVVTEEHVVRLTCSASDLWRMDAMEVYLDPSQWDPFSYQSYFGADVDPGYMLGSGLYSTQTMVPIHPEENRYLFKSYVTGSGMGDASAPAGTLLAAGFLDGSDNKTVAVEMRFPWWGPAASTLPTDMYISWGYNEWRATFMGWSCSDNFPIQHRWQAQPDGAGGWLTIDPSGNEDSGAKLTLSTTEAVPSATGSAEVAGVFNPGPARCAAAPDDPMCVESAREAALPAASKFRVVRQGNSLVLSGASSSVTSLHTMDGLEILSSRQSVIDVSGLKTGVYLVQNGTSRKAFVK